MDKDQTIAFIKNYKNRNGLCCNHVISQFVIDNWDIIATECYIRSKAHNLAKLLGMDIEESNEIFQVLQGIVYRTGHEIDNRKDIAEGWEFFNEERFSQNELVEMRIDTLLGKSIKTGKILKVKDGLYAFLPKGNRTRGIYLNNHKIRKISLNNH